MTGQTTPGSAPLRYRPGPARQEIAELLDGLRTDGGVRVVTGDPGCGRTAFLAFAARSFRAGPVWHVRADPPRPERPHGGLRTLLRAADRPVRLPGDGTAGEVLLGVLRAAAAASPLLVCVDDVHRWDAASRAALGDAAARVHATGGRVGLLLSVPGHRPVDRQMAGLPVWRLAPLTPGDAAALVDEATEGTVDPAVREELVTEAEGNPALLLALVRHLSPAQLRGRRALPRPLAGAEVLAGVAGGCLTGVPPDHADLLLATAAAVRATGEPDADAGLVRRAAGILGGRAAVPAPETAPPAGARVQLSRTTGSLPETLVLADGRLRFRSALLGRTVYAGAPPGRRRAVHRALAESLADPHGVPALLHRSWTVTGPAPALAAELAATAADPASALPPDLRRAAHARAAELTPDDAERAHRYTAAARQALLAGDPAEALRLLDAARSRPAPASVRGDAELLRGAVLLADGPVDDARESFLLAAGLLTDRSREEADTAVLGAANAAWAAGDLTACLQALAPDGSLPREPAPAPVPTAAPASVPAADAPPAGPVGADAGGTAPPGPAGSTGPTRSALLRDHRDGMRAVLLGRFDLAAAPLRRVVEWDPPADEPERLLGSAAAALMLGEVTAARRSGARALAAARTLGSAALEPRALEYLAYAELRAGRHQLARTHAEEGLRTARRTGQRNTAAHHHAVLALAASIEGERELVAEHAAAALGTARRHGLAQAATLAQWALARADLGAGRPREAVDRLGPLVRPGARRGHFAVWMLAVPCFVEAAALAGRPAHARTVLEDFALWAACRADPQAPAQLLRCRALLAAPEVADELYLRALDRHEETAGDFERARTELLYGKWLRRRRRLGEARARLGEALMGFERCGAHPWGQQAAAELRANGAAPGGAGTVRPARHGPGELSRLTPQQLRIARCVAEGATNREVALSLSVSTRTVDYHLRNVFATLGVRSRVELARLVEQAEKTGAQL
ncbi:helix-turn-helix transcriptional regulator [Streptomyces sp. NWU49]|uniref:helix-turn-helix transcriptional regulator n=1 Tax=Streptomyces sp. NWU49 TaxID=2201153 RepID=UPI000D67F46B|nr:LuxR family transcriptional regulator [Streptomyces sp. NWU49]PWJ05133.1 helix-turn-helix transcriptional regulator [Streptomyces sp. NWU49]